MLATPVRPIPADQLYEPKWDGLIKLNSLRCRADLWSDELAVDRLSVRPQGADGLALLGACGGGFRVDLRS